MDRRSITNGFTIVELLIVIVVIGILAAITIVSYNGIQDRAKRVAVQQYAKQFETFTALASISSGKSLFQMTGNGCIFCSCIDEANNRTVNNSPTCRSDLKSVVDILAAANGSGSSSVLLSDDPWGNSYLIDANVGEFSAEPCREDSVMSAGKDSRLGTADDIVLTFSSVALGQCS